MSTSSISETRGLLTQRSQRAEPDGQKCLPYILQNQGRSLERSIILCWAIVRRREAKVPMRRDADSVMMGLVSLENDVAPSLMNHLISEMFAEVLSQCPSR